MWKSSECTILSQNTFVSSLAWDAFQFLEQNPTSFPENFIDSFDSFQNKYLLTCNCEG